MSTFTDSDSYSFTISHARHLAAKVATDMKRIQRFCHSYPTDAEIEGYEQELIAILKAGYLDSVTYGFKKNGEWIKPTLRYTAKELADSYYAKDDDPGKIRPPYDVSDAHFSSYLCYNSSWWKLSSDERHAFKKSLPFYRSAGDEPRANGQWQSDLTYSSGTRSLNRSLLT